MAGRPQWACLVRLRKRCAIIARLGWQRHSELQEPQLQRLLAELPARRPQHQRQQRCLLQRHLQPQRQPHCQRQRRPQRHTAARGHAARQRRQWKQQQQQQPPQLHAPLHSPQAAPARAAAPPPAVQQTQVAVGPRTLAPRMPQPVHRRTRSQLATLRCSNEIVAQALQTLIKAVEQPRALFDVWEGNV